MLDHEQIAELEHQYKVATLNISRLNVERAAKLDGIKSLLERCFQGGLVVVVLSLTTVCVALAIKVIFQIFHSAWPAL